MAAPTLFRCWNPNPGPPPPSAPVTSKLPLSKSAAILVAVLATCWLAVVQPATAAERPNILWITSEDNGPELGCYGDAYATTPNIDRLAARGQLYLNCWSNAPVCAPARTTLITGMYPTSLGGQHMRSHVALPPEVQLYPQLFQQLGYYCSNNVKEDYNVAKPPRAWHDSSGKAHWRNRAAGQPFFAVFNFTSSHESQIRKRPHRAVHDPAQAPIPSYHPDTPEVRQDWAQYYDQLTVMDSQVGEVLSQLRDDRLEEDTIIVYYGDHGSGMPRGKRWLYQSGLHVPLIVVIPPRWQHLVEGQYAVGSRSERLVSFVDLPATMLSLAGTEAPQWMHGSAFLGPHAAEPRSYLFGFRDRMDERVDMSRAVRNGRMLYIRNFYPQRPQGTFLAYMFQTPTTAVWHDLFKQGRLTPEQSAFWQPKPVEELYDIANDPQQLHNLASDPAQAEPLQQLRDALRGWMIETRDLGLLPEGEMFDRAQRDAPYTMGQDPQRFNPQRLLDAADAAHGIGIRAGSSARPGSGSGRALQELLSQRVASDSGVRFWTANGMLWRAQQNPDEREEIVRAARGMLTDPSPYVSCLAQEILGRFGKPADRDVALRTLLRFAEPGEHNILVSILALNSLDWCQPTAEELGPRLEQLATQDSRFDARYQEYPARLIERIRSVAQPANVPPSP
jgi:arylsulfatase A-like enzyme